MFLNLLDSEATWFPLLFDTAFDIVRSVAVWLTLALILAFVITFFLLKGESRRKFAKIYGIGSILYAGVLGILFLCLSFAEDGIVTILFVPLLILIAVLLTLKKKQ